MIRIVLGFKEHSTRAEPECLYAGHDGDKAREVLEDPGEGFVKAELGQVQTIKSHVPLTDAEKKGAAKNAAAEKKAKEAAAKAKEAAKPAEKPEAAKPAEKKTTGPKGGAAADGKK